MASSQGSKSVSVDRLVASDKFEIRQHPNQGRHTLLVRLDADRLKAYGITKAQVMEAVLPTSLSSPHQDVTDVIKVERLGWLDQYQEIIVRASPDGEAIRLRNVATIDWMDVPSAPTDRQK